MGRGGGGASRRGRGRGGEARDGASSQASPVFGDGVCSTAVCGQRDGRLSQAGRRVGVRAGERPSSPSDAR